MEYPRDALALQWAQLWDYYRGAATGLRQCPARAMPDWDEGDPRHPYVLALNAFGLEECSLYLTRLGVLAEEQGSTSMADNDADSGETRALRPLQAAACTYRIAFGPRARQKALTLQGAMLREMGFN